MKFVIKKLKYILENNDFNEEVNKQTNNYLKLFEQEIIRIQNHFYTNDKNI